MTNLSHTQNIFDQDLSELVKVRYIPGNLFSQDNGGNEIGVRCFYKGEPNSIAGNIVSANVIRADGVTVPLTGAIYGDDNNIALINLTGDCYEIPGPITIVVKITGTYRTTTIGAFITNNYLSATDTVVDPGSFLPSIQSLISSINTAVASIPAGWEIMWQTFAPAFSISTNYTAGQYVTYGDPAHLYRFTSNHTAGVWNSSHVTAVNVGGELSSKTDLRVVAPPFYNETNYVTGQYVTYNGKLWRFTADHPAGEWNSSHVTEDFVGYELYNIDTNWRAVALNLSGQKTDLTVIAPAFYEGTDYVKGQYVVYYGKLYKFDSNHSAGPWNSTHVTEVYVGSELNNTDANWRAAVSEVKTGKANLSIIASQFYSDVAYYTGQYVIHDGKLYKFTSDHPAGAWNSAHVTEDFIGYELSNIDANWRAEVVDLKTGKTNLTVIAPPFYADTVYYKGQYVTHDGKCYKFTSDHPAGVWNTSHVAEVYIGSELSNIDANWRAEVIEVKLGKTNLTVIAPPFYADTTYYKGQYVTHDGKCYKFTSDHPAAAWNSGHVTEVYIGSELSNIDANWRAEVVDLKNGKADTVLLAPAFYAGTNYVIGQYVTYSGKLYRFTSNHSAGAWNSSHVAEVSAGLDLNNHAQEIDTLNEDVDNLERALDYLKPIKESTEEDVDLDIVDENGNVILRLEDGHIKTKEFDSSELPDLLEEKQDVLTFDDAPISGSNNPVRSNGIYNALQNVKGDTQVRSAAVAGTDLYITDATGNVLTMFANGNVRTKNFNSDNGIYEFRFEYEQEAGTAEIVKNFPAGTRLAFHLTYYNDRERDAIRSSKVTYKYTDTNGITRTLGTDYGYNFPEYTLQYDAVSVSVQYGNAMSYSDTVLSFKVYSMASFPRTPNVITVSTSGDKDYTSLRDAVEYARQYADQVNRYEIHIYPGTYDIMSYYTAEEKAVEGFIGLLISNGISLVGIGHRSEVILTATLSTDDYTVSQRNYVSTINIQGNVAIRNLTIKAENIRYAVHDDKGMLTHQTNTHIFEYVTFIGKNLTSSSDSDLSYGAGGADMKKLFFYNCDFTDALTLHTTNDFSHEYTAYFENCRARMMQFGDYDSGVPTHIYLVNCCVSRIRLGTSGNHDQYMLVEGEGTNGVMVESPSGYVYAMDGVHKFAGSNISAGTAVKLSSDMKDVQAATSLNEIYGISIGTLGGTTYVQTEGWLNSNTLGISGLSVGDYLTIDSNGTVVSGGTLTNAIAIVKHINSNGVAFAKIMI